jgi:hypothetical protein
VSAPPAGTDEALAGRGAERGRAYGLSAVLLVLMLSPLFRRPPVDSFPLSTYPMFSFGRRDATTVVERALGVDVKGVRRPIPPRLVGSEEVLQAKATLAQSIRQGQKATRALCRDIAARVAQESAFADIVSVEIRTDTFDAVAFFEGQKDPKDSKVHATCKAVRP